MHKLLNTTILITFWMLIIGIITGCGDDDLPEEVKEPLQSDDTDPSNPTTGRGTPRRIDDIPPQPIQPFNVTPAPGAEIPPNTEFLLNFDQAVVGVIAQWCCSHRIRRQLDRIADATARR